MSPEYTLRPQQPPSSNVCSDWSAFRPGSACSPGGTVGQGRHVARPVTWHRELCAASKVQRPQPGLRRKARERLRHPTCLKIRPRGGERRATTSSELQPPRSSAVRLPRFDRSGSALSFRHPPPRSRVCKAGSDSSSGSAVKALHELRSSICSEVRPERAGSAAIEVQPLMSSVCRAARPDRSGSSARLVQPDRSRSCNELSA